MNSKLFAAFLILASVVAFAAGRTTAGSASKLQPQTQKNLDTAMHGEAFAYAKYLLFAQQARANGHPEIANLFESAAKTERFEHFSEEAKLSGLVGSDADNLRNAIQGENYETTTMYPQFAEQARRAGDTAAAQRFSEIAKDEAKHRDAFSAALQKLEGPQGRRAPTGR